MQVLTGAQRKVPTEAAATCVCPRRKSTNIPPNSPACVQRDRSWLPTAFAAGLVSRSTTAEKLILVCFWHTHVQTCPVTNQICNMQAAFWKIWLFSFFFFFFHSLNKCCFQLMLNHIREKKYFSYTNLCSSHYSMTSCSVDFAHLAFFLYTSMSSKSFTTKLHTSRASQ